jgi:hypothetical protein
VAATSLKLPGFHFGKALAAAQEIFAERTTKSREHAELAASR